MALATTTTTPLALAPPPAPPRPRVLLVGTALVSAAAFMLFAGLIGVYLAVRAATLAAGDPWLPETTVIPLLPGNVGMVTLLLSVVTMQWAVYAIGNDDRPNTYVALGLTLLLGLAFINATAFLYTQMALDLRASGAAVLIYVTTGAHLAMVGAALIFNGLMAFRTLGGQYSGRDREGITAAAMFWYVTVGVYAVIWYSIYITK
jgi:heme/copper-type cytochrome/quinol oxidase subunit 3